ncbi:MAG TPA: TolC family protein [Terriglobia bacterium]|nr:TolC family protein [Terriglobia bacterium]
MRTKTLHGLVILWIAGVICCVGQVMAQQTSGSAPTPPSSDSSIRNFMGVDYTHTRSSIPYFAPSVPDISMENSPRLRTMIQNGKLELSLDDAIGFALENNLDIAVARYSLLYAKTDILRTAAGSSFRGINPGLLGVVSAFSGGGSGGGTGGTGGAGGVTGGGGARNIGSFGCCDPFAGVSFGWDHNSTPLNFTVVSGVPVSTSQTSSMTAFVGKGFLTGTSVAFALSGFRSANNQLNQLFNPETPSGLEMGFNQPLLNGFGYRANAKFIRIAKNDVRLADSTFKQQVITTVANVVNLYSDLVSFKENVRVAQQALTYAQKLLEDNKRQVEIGTLAPIEVVRAESEVANDEQALIVAQTSYQQQQELLKTAISKHVGADLTGAAVEPTDKLPEPSTGDIQPLDVALKEAEANRPELVTVDTNIRNQEITVQASRNGLLPSLSLFGTYAPTGLSGNSLTCPKGTTLSVIALQCAPGSLAPTLSRNGIWQSLSQGFRGAYPDYSFGVNLSIPIRNRQAQADMTTALLQQRQLKVQLQQQKNAIAQDVRNAEIAVIQARAGVAAAAKATQLNQETYDAEKKKFQLGESTVFNVILTQRDLATAEGTEVKARDTYAKALVQFGQATATILDTYGIEFADAKNGESTHVHNIPGTRENAPPGGENKNQ